MDGLPPRTLPEELLPACVHPRSGRIRRTGYFHRVLAGACLGELELLGAVTLADGDRITAVRPVRIADPTTEGLLARILAEVLDGAWGRRPIRLLDAPEENWPTPFPETAAPREATGFAGQVRQAMKDDIAARAPHWSIEQWIALWKGFQRIEERYLDGLEGRGLLVADRSQLLGVVPWTRRRAVSTGRPAGIAERVARGLDPAAGAGTSGQEIRRVRRLAALIGAADLSGRLFDGRGYRDTRRRIHQLEQTDPFALEVRKVRLSDLRSD